MLRYTYLSASNLFMCVLIFLFVYLYLSISLYVHSSLPIAVCIEKGNPLMRCSYCAGHTVGELYIYFNSSHYRFFPFLFFLCVIHVSFMGASIVCVTNLDWTVDSVLWFPEKTSDWKTLGTKKPKNILCSQYFTSIKISTQMVCFLCCQIMCTSISRPTLERERRGGGEQTLRPYSSRRIASARHVAWMSGLALKWVRLAPNLDKSGIFPIIFQ